MTEDQEQPKTRDFRGPGEWRSQAVRAREAALALKQGGHASVGPPVDDELDE